MYYNYLDHNFTDYDQNFFNFYDHNSPDYDHTYDYFDYEYE
jgi:hypothetical protein